jgi:DmsE family decaheme c-type cytochrome
VVFKKGVYEKSGEDKRADQCLTCHKGTKRNNWAGSAHPVNDVVCNDCHKVHKPADPVLSKQTQTQVCFTCHKDVQADTKKNSTHPIDVKKVVCSDCHNPHGSTGPTLLKKNTLNETCYLCHAEKRGPLRFEHQPVVENCANCHTPHGSNISPLLKSRPPYMCQECHDGPHTTSPAGFNAGSYQSGLSTTVNPSTSFTGRACMNCHVMVHGSNSPAGGYLQR